MDIRKTTIETERLILRVISEDFADMVLDYHIRNKDFFKEWEPVRDKQYYTLDYQRQLLNSDLRKIKEGTMFKVWIFKKCDKSKTIGLASLNNIIRSAFQSCHLGYKLDKDEINKGYMPEALRALIRFAFKDLKLHRIEANIMPKNKRSLRVVEKLGFYEEGLAKKYLKINGKWEDHIHMVLLNEEMS